jgi:hypothetical protein
MEGRSNPPVVAQGLLAKLPPHFPLKVATSISGLSSYTPATIKREGSIPARATNDATCLNIETGTKRSHNEFRDNRGEQEGESKAGRLNERVHDSISRRGPDIDDGRSYQGGRDSPPSRRSRSRSRDNFSYWRDGRDTFDAGRGRGRRRGYERDRSPGLQVHEISLSRSFPGPVDHFRRGEDRDRSYSDRAYLGRDHDPDYHAKRGRGRAKVVRGR